MAVKRALDSILENEMNTGFQYKLAANLKQSKVMVVRSMRVSYADLFFSEREASQYVTAFFNTYSGTTIQNYLYKKKYYKTPHDGIVHIPKGEITDYSPNGGVYGFKVNDRYFSWDYREELYYDLYNRVYSPNGEVIVGARTPRYIKEAYKKLSEVRIKHPAAYLEHINRYGANEMVINYKTYDPDFVFPNSIGWSSMSGGFYEGGKDFSTTNYPEPHGVGAYTPVVGSLWNAKHDYQDGDYGWAAFNTAIAISDVFLVNSIRKGVMKGGLKVMTKNYGSWSSYRRFFGKEGFAEAGQHLHHSFWERNGQRVGNSFKWKMKNQMWNLKPLPKRFIDDGFKWNDIHRAIEGKSSPLYLNSIERFYYGTPTWIYPFGGSTIGRGIQPIFRD